MTRRFSCLLGSAAMMTIMSLPAAAQEYSNGGHGTAGRGPAILAPVEAYGVHPPGLDPAEAQNRCSSSRQRYFPYYAPLSPVASSARWQPWSYAPLLPYYTPYYPGYCPHRLFTPPPRRYGSDGWGRGPQPEMSVPEEPGTTPLNYSDYTSVVEDDTKYWNMGGNGLVPYGVPQTGAPGSPDLIDAIQASRPRGRLRGHFFHAEPRDPVIVQPTEIVGEQGQEGHAPKRSSRRRVKPAEPIPPGDILQQQGEESAPDGSSRRRTKPAEASPADGTSN